MVGVLRGIVTRRRSKVGGKRKGAGRKPTGLPTRNRIVHVRVTERQLTAWEGCAFRASTYPVSAWLRDLAEAEARRVFPEYGD